MTPGPSLHQEASKKQILEDSELQVAVGKINRLEKELKQEKSIFKWAFVFVSLIGLIFITEKNQTLEKKYADVKEKLLTLERKFIIHFWKQCFTVF